MVFRLETRFSLSREYADARFLSKRPLTNNIEMAKRHAARSHATVMSASKAVSESFDGNESEPVNELIYHPFPWL